MKVSCKVINWNKKKLHTGDYINSLIRNKELTKKSLFGGCFFFGVVVVVLVFVINVVVVVSLNSSFLFIAISTIIYMGLEGQTVTLAFKLINTRNNTITCNDGGAAQYLN